jgi:hypothetical protein
MKNRTKMTTKTNEIYLKKMSLFVTLTPQHESLVLVTKVQYDRIFENLFQFFAERNKGALVILRMPSS